MSQEYFEHVADLLHDWHPVSCKKMFDGYAIYCNAVVFAIIIGGVLYFKVGDDDLQRYESASSAPFTYETRGRVVKMSYWIVPDRLLDDRDEFVAWANKAYLVALNCKKAKTKKTK